MNTIETAFEAAGYTEPKSASEKNMESAVRQIMDDEDGPTAERLTIEYATEAAGNINDSVAPDTIGDKAEVDLSLTILQHVQAITSLMDDYMLGDLSGAALEDATKYPVGNREYEPRDCSFPTSKIMNSLCSFTHYGLAGAKKAASGNAARIKYLNRQKQNDYGTVDDDVLVANSRQAVLLKQIEMLMALDVRFNDHFEHLAGSEWKPYQDFDQQPSTTAGSVESEQLLAKTAALLGNGRSK